MHKSWHLLLVCYGHKIINHSTGYGICTQALEVRVQQEACSMRPLTDVTALVSLCSDLHGFPGKIKPEQAQLLLPRPHIVITRLCVLAGTSAPCCQWTPPPPGQAVWPSTSDCSKKASQLPTASHNTSLHTGKRCLFSREYVTCAHASTCSTVGQRWTRQMLGLARLLLFSSYHRIP